MLRDEQPLAVSLAQSAANIWWVHIARAYGGERVLSARMHVWMDRLECRTELRNQNPNARHCVTRQHSEMRHYNTRTYQKSDRKIWN